MTTDAIPTLSEISRRPTSRREFLLKSSVLGTLAPFALSACDIDKSGQNAGASGGSRSSTPPPAGPATAVRNADSKLDTGGHANVHQSTSAAAAGKTANLPFRTYDPALPPVSGERTLKIQFTAQEVPIRISDDTVISAWTFDGDIPGPIVHVRQGDTVDFTLSSIRGPSPIRWTFTRRR